jgi:hypothetical protein
VNGDAVEDLVFQITFTGKEKQKVTLRGPYTPKTTGAQGNVLVGGKQIKGSVGEVIGDAKGSSCSPVRAMIRSSSTSSSSSASSRTAVRPPGRSPCCRLPRRRSARRRGRGLRPQLQRPRHRRRAPRRHAVGRRQAPGRFGVWGTTSRARGS